MMAIRFLNQPAVKEGIKNIATTMTFAFGLVEVCDLYQIYQGRSICHSSAPEGSPPWAKTAYKASLISAKMSLLLSGATSRPGVYLISKSCRSCIFNKSARKVFRQKHRLCRQPLASAACCQYRRRHFGTSCQRLLAV